MMIEELKGKIVENGFTQGEIAKILGISRESLNAKLNNRGSFMVGEAIDICAILNITNPKEIFFENYFPNVQQG